MKKNPRAFLFAHLLFVCFIGCQKPATETPMDLETQETPLVTILDGRQPSAEQKEAMLAAKDALFAKLSARLMETMTGQGPAAAISVCSQEAPRIAADVGETHGVIIGRTGVRLRNSRNKAPGWAVPLVEAKADAPTFVTLSNDHAAALLPIKLQAQCLVCHGSKEQMSPLVLGALKKLYPEDAATGFSEGELRGWFWIEIP